jgi:hypothetical protein
MSVRQYAILVAFVGCVALPAPGSCAIADDEIASVKGAVTLDGKPIPTGRIIFFTGNDQFVGAKIKDGMFKMDRVPVGIHKVAVESNGVPTRYSSEDATELRIEVIKGSMSLDFHLISK